MSSSKPRKQRKTSHTAPWHKAHKMLSAPLSPELRKTYGRRSFPVRKGDTVRILRGDRRGEEGKIVKVDYDNGRVYIKGITRERVNGTVVLVPIHPSKVMITKLALDDKVRKEALTR